VFYLRYQHRDTVNELRGNLKEANKEIQYLTGELEEFTQQNGILKEKITELLEKNDDLSEVVSELSKYYVHLKRAAEKTTELSKFLHTPNPNIEEKMNHYVNTYAENKPSDTPKTFF
jgi:arginine deiminase